MDGLPCSLKSKGLFTRAPLIKVMGDGCMSPRTNAIFLTTLHTTSTHTNIPHCAIQYFTGTARSAHSLNVFFNVTSGFPRKERYIYTPFSYILFPFPNNFLLVSTVVIILLLESFALRWAKYKVRISVSFILPQVSDLANITQ